MKYELQLIDVCLPDYFRGHHLPIIQFPIYHSGTLAGIKEALLTEVQALWEHYEFNGVDPHDLIEAINNLTSDQPEDFLHFADVPVPPEEDECPNWNYAYFVAVPV